MRIVFALVWVVLLVGCATGERTASLRTEPTSDELQNAIDAIRGVDLQAVSKTQKVALGKRLDAAWSTLRQHPKQAKPMIREALENEADDDFFLIDLSYLYLSLDGNPADLKDVSKWLLRANPNAYPEGDFYITSGMASLGCEPCQPTVLRMLELERLDAYISAHALSIDLDLGLLFTVVPYGERILPEVTARLGSSDCVVRANAAFAIGLLLPPETPARLTEMAESDSCERARDSSMRSLGIVDPPALIRVVDESMGAEVRASRSELLAIVEALSLAPVRLSLPRLEALSRHSDKEVAVAARSAFDAIRMVDAAPELPRLSSSRDAGARSRLLRELAAANSNRRFNYDGSPYDLVAALTVEDYSALNGARLAVLRRLSDECLYEFHALHAAALLFREAMRTGSTPGR